SRIVLSSSTMSTEAWVLFLMTIKASRRALRSLNEREHFLARVTVELSNACTIRFTRRLPHANRTHFMDIGFDVARDKSANSVAGMRFDTAVVNDERATRSSAHARGSFSPP